MAGKKEPGTRTLGKVEALFLASQLAAGPPANMPAETRQRLRAAVQAAVAKPSKRAVPPAGARTESAPWDDDDALETSALDGFRSRLYRVSQERVQGHVWLYEAEAHCPAVDGASVKVSRQQERAGGGEASLTIGIVTVSGVRSWAITETTTLTLPTCSQVTVRRAAELLRLGYAYNPDGAADFYVYSFDAWTEPSDMTTETLPITICPCRTGQPVETAQSISHHRIRAGSQESLSVSLRQDIGLGIGVGTGPAEKSVGALKLGGKYSRTVTVTLENTLPGGHDYTAATLRGGTQVWSAAPRL